MSPSTSSGQARRGIPGKNEPIGRITVTRERQAEVMKRLLDCTALTNLKIEQLAELAEHVAIMIAADIERARLAQACRGPSGEPSCEASRSDMAEEAVS